MIQLFMGNGEPGGARSRHQHRKCVTCSFYDVQDLHDFQNFPVSRQQQYVYSTRDLSQKQRLGVAQ